MSLREHLLHLLDRMDPYQSSQNAMRAYVEEMRAEVIKMHDDREDGAIAPDVAGEIRDALIRLDTKIDRMGTDLAMVARRRGKTED